MLDLSPETESRLMEYAQAEGVTINDLLDRHFPPRNPMLRLLEEQLREVENATPEEIAKANAEYRQWQQNMNDTRRANGERLLFPDVP